MCLAEQDEMNQQLQQELEAARGGAMVPQQATPQTPYSDGATPLTAAPRTASVSG